MIIKEAPTYAVAILRLNALKRAELSAKNPEFKTLWAKKRSEYIKILQSGSSYDELTGEVL